jgi:NADH-ubiquinone oxidoreductase chain 6
MTTFLINFLALGILISGIFSITSKNPIISIIFLILTFVQAAGYLILIGINFVGISYIVIYVGAIAVLFLFVIMMINIKLTDILETGNQYTKNLPLAIAIFSLIIYIIYTIIPFNFYNDPTLYLLLKKFIFFAVNTDLNISNIDYNFLYSIPSIINNLNLHLLNNSNFISPFQADVLFTSFLQIELLGHSLYNNGAILLIILSFILLLAMYAIIIISSKSS